MNKYKSFITFKSIDGKSYSYGQIIDSYEYDYLDASDQRKFYELTAEVIKREKEMDKKTNELNYKLIQLLCNGKFDIKTTPDEHLIKFKNLLIELEDYERCRIIQNEINKRKI